MKAFPYLIAAVCLVAAPVDAGYGLASVAADSGPVAAHVATSCNACNGGPQSAGSLSDFPGGCCKNQDRANCCASLWADYCRDKKPCWTPNSPRRDMALNRVGCGAGCDFLRHPCLTGGCSRCATHAGGCGNNGACDSPNLTVTPSALGYDTNSALNPATPVTAPEAIPGGSSPLDTPNAYQPAPTTEPPKQISPNTTPSEQPTPPEPGSEARRRVLPFGLNSPNPKQTFPFDSKPTAKRNTFPFSR